MSLHLRNSLSRRENERIVRRVLDTKIRIGGRSSSIRNKGRARNLETEDGYAIVKAIKEVIEGQRLDVIQEDMLFAELHWRFECSKCHIVKDLSEYVEANSFQIKVTDNDFKLKSVGCCLSCDEWDFDNSWGNYQLGSGSIQDLPGAPVRNNTPRR